jgi:hypothetical protein
MGCDPKPCTTDGDEHRNLEKTLWAELPAAHFMKAMFKLTAILLLAFIAQNFSFAMPRLEDPYEQQKMTVWELKNTSGDWHEIYDGFGLIQYNQHNGITIQTKVPTSPTETHASLVLARKTEKYPLKDFVVSIKVSTEKQLREPKANPWEVFWIFFNHSFDQNQNPAANYFMLKPNGLELGRAYDKIKQKILFTQALPTLTFGKPHSIILIKISNHVDISIDGKHVMSFLGANPPKHLYDVLGAIGLYVEDARVHIYHVSIIPLNLSH